MLKHHYPVVIIGAGPAGVAASLRLSDLQIPHLIIDKETFPRDKICGDALSGKVVDTLRSIDSLSTEFIKDSGKYLPTPGIRFFGPNQKHVDIPFPPRDDEYATGYIAKRKVFDADLVALLDERFANTAFLTSFSGINKNTKEINLDGQGDSATIKYDMLIAADGATSKISEELNGNSKQNEKHHSIALRAYYKGVSGFEQNLIELHFIKDLMPGYFWIFPLPNGEANVGLGMLSSVVRKKGINLRKKLQKLLAEHPLLKERFKNAEQIDSTQGWGLTLGSKPRKISDNGILLTGDAAWLIDPFTGEGIGNAIISGKKAADWTAKALKKKDVSAQFLRGYDKEIYDKLGAELKLSFRLQQLSQQRILFNLIINRATSSKRLQETMTTMYTSLDMRKKLKNPFFYLGLLLGK